MIDFPREKGGRPVVTHHYIDIHDQAKSPFIVMVANQHHGAVEIGASQFTAIQQQLALQIGLALWGTHFAAEYATDLHE